MKLSRTFTFSRSGVIGQPTAEQQAVLDKLQAGELTPEEAAAALGGKAHHFETEIKLGGDGGEPLVRGGGDSLLQEAFAPPPDPSRFPWGRTFGTVFAGLVLAGAVMWVAGGDTTRQHLFTTALTIAVVFGLVVGLASPSGLARLAPSGVAMNRVAWRGGLVAATCVVAWGLLAIVGGHWSAFFIGIVFILLGAGVLVVLLLGQEAASRTRSTIELLRRRQR